MSHFTKTALTSVILGFLCLLFLVLPKQVFAVGTVTATILDPHGTAVPSASYTFSKGASTVTGTTDSGGVISQSLSAGTWSLSVTPPSSVLYADTLTISTIFIADGSTAAMGNIYFTFQVPSGTDSDLGQFATIPVQCTASGTPVIMRAYYEDETKGSFLFQGRNASVIVVTDDPTNTVTVDYSIIEGHAIGTDVVAAVSQGGGKFKATRVIANTALGGGMPIVTATRSSSSTGYCPPAGPVNLDIRTFFTGSQTTDFSSVTDFRAIPNFTMHQTNVVKVTFNKSVDMLDPTVQRFMKSIAQKMVGSNGSLNLDAKAVLELKNAGASVTFYGITLNNPKVQVDGKDDATGVASSITYDRNAHTLTFNAGHFTTFTLVENTSSGSSSSSPCSGPCLPSCNDLTPTAVPNLFQVDVVGTSANLYFAKLNENVTGYGVSFGLTKDASQYADLFSYLGPLWIVNRNVSLLSPNTVYYFKVRAVNGCNAGGWSNVMKITTNGKGSENKVVYRKNLPSQTVNTVTSKKTAVTPDTSDNTQTPATIQPSPQQPIVPTVVAPVTKSRPVVGGSFWNTIVSFFKSLFGG